MDKHAIIKLKQKNISNRQVAKILGINRKTVAKYWNEHAAYSNQLKKDGVDKKAVQEKICSEPTYNSSNRKSKKYTGEMDRLLDEILADEKEKCKLLGTDKQQRRLLFHHHLFLGCTVFS